MPVKIPTLGLVIKNVIIVEWMAQEGQAVSEGDPLLVVETDKVTFEVTAPASGVLLKKMFNRGQKVEVEKTIVAIIGQEGEDISQFDSQTDEKMTVNLDEASSPQPTDSKQSHTNAMPAAKRLAKKYGINLSDLKGTGQDGLITRKDVEAFYQSQEDPESTPNVIEPVPTSNLTGAATEEIIPFVGIRKTIAEHMVHSKNVAAHVTTLDEVDMTKAIEFRKELEKELNTRISIVAIIVKAAVQALKKYPILNSVLDNDRIVIKKYVHSGIAVATEKGLMVPVLHSVHLKSIAEIGTELEKMVALARTGKIEPQMMQGGTITISNPGPFGALIATPIINQPQSAIVWSGRIGKKPVVVDDEICIRSMMYLCVSYDHRVMDGVTAAQYIQQVKKTLQNPWLFSA